MLLQQTLAIAVMTVALVASHLAAAQGCPEKNLNYWRFGDYLGVGAGADNKLSFANRVVRGMRDKQPRQYKEQA